ncbi:hypothetical protein [Pelagibius sp. 7325]|uniref:hypothetical protein n=1 Tax=Pelagibius sp. 7325 TaxID=3131994 RepID=UPI0030ECFA20
MTGRPLLAAALAVLLLPAAAMAQDGVTFFTGPNFTGASKTLTLAPDQPYAALPYVGDELNDKIASLRADPGVGVILFQRPHFASRDDACGPNLGTAQNPDAWWLGLTADFAPITASDGLYEAAQTADDDYSSVIAYRRQFGPPPGFLLLERRSYYNRSCDRSEDQSYFNRLFVPVPNPPQREACTDLTTPAAAPGAGADAPAFVRISEAYALLPEAFSRSYQGIDHRFILTLFDGPGCSGTSITLPSLDNGRPAGYRLSEYDFDRKVRSVMIRYLRGPLDAYMREDAAPAAAALAPAPAAPAPTEPAVQAAPSAAAQAAPSATPPSEPSTPQQPAPQTATRAQPAPVPAPTETPAPAATPAPVATPAPAPTPQPAPQAATPAPAAPPAAAAVPASPAPASPAPVTPAPVTPAPATPAPVSGGLQPAPPSAPEPQQQVLQPAPQVPVVPVQPVPAPSRPVGPQQETFRFPVHQVYRLNFCLADEQGCGEPAANAWCETRGFTRASRWTQEENIGALYPTVFIGSGSICDKFLCDGFEEITCTQ